MHVLVTGATGFLGSRIVEFLSEKNEFTSILGTGRNLSPENTVNAPHVQYKLGDLVDENFVFTLFETPPDIVINCASRTSPWGNYDTFFNANFVTQSNLLKYSIPAQVKRFIYISTPSVYFDFSDQLNIKEDNPFPKEFVNYYAASKANAERLLPKANLDFVILRPRALIGRGDTVIMPRMINSYLKGKLRIIGDGNNVVDLTPVSNVVDAVYSAISTSKVNCRKTYNISNGEPVKLWDAINYVLTGLGYEKVEKNIPYSLAQAIAQAMEWKAYVFHRKREPVLTKYAVGILGKSFSLNIDEAKRCLFYIPKQSTYQALDEFIKWYKNK